MKSLPAKDTIIEARNCRLARKLWGTGLSRWHIQTLRELTRSFQFSVLVGDLLLLEGKWYVTHTGLIRLARRNHCAGIHVRPVPEFSDSAAQRWAFEATVYKSRICRGFVGYGDADPSNVSPVVHGAELRVAETRAVNRALRKAYGIGICSIEEIGLLAEPQPPQKSKKLAPQPTNGNYGGPKVRDRLCQIIRQHQLDPTLVKSYATDFCGVKSLREATREQVENFVVHLADWAEKDRNALLCQLQLRPEIADFTESSPQKQRHPSWDVSGRNTIHIDVPFVAPRRRRLAREQQKGVNAKLISSLFRLPGFIGSATAIHFSYSFVTSPS